VPHEIVPNGQVQAPAVQVNVPAQSTPQLPQLLLFDFRSTQAPAQLVRPALHVAVHVPRLHACPVGQVTPQAPQFTGSLSRFTQTPLHIS
jgi:hypothetical protein